MTPQEVDEFLQSPVNTFLFKNHYFNKESSVWAWSARINTNLSDSLRILILSKTKKLTNLLNIKNMNIKSKVDESLQLFIYKVTEKVNH